MVPATDRYVCSCGFLDLHSCEPNTALYTLTAQVVAFAAESNPSIFDLVGPALDELGATYLDPPFPGSVQMTNWAAMGDSVSSGPGAGCRYEKSARRCHRNDGAYAAKMKQDAKFIYDYRSPQLIFESCSGDKVDGVSTSR